VYTAVIEPYLRGRRHIAALRMLAIENRGAADSAVEVMLGDGRRDVIVQCADDSTAADLSGGIRFQGRLMIARFGADGELSELLSVRPSYVKIGDVFEQEYTPYARGKVESFDKGAPTACTITVDGTLTVPRDVLRPLWTDITSSPDANGNYRIQSVTAQDGKTVLGLGNVSFVSGFDPERQQFTYAFAEGATLEVPFSYYWKGREK